MVSDQCWLVFGEGRGYWPFGDPNDANFGQTPIHADFKQARGEADERTSDVILRTYRNSARVARNAVSQEALRLEAKGRPFEEVAFLVKLLIDRIVDEAEAIIREKRAGMPAQA